MYFFIFILIEIYVSNSEDACGVWSGSALFAYVPKKGRQTNELMSSFAHLFIITSTSFQNLILILFEMISFTC